MFDRVEICVQCGEIGKELIFPQFTLLNDFGCRAGILCHHCGLFRVATFSWELSYRLLRRNLRFCRSRHSIFGRSDWKPINDLTTLGQNQVVAVKYQVTEMWPRMFPLLLIRDLDDSAEPDDLKVFKHLLRQTSGSLTAPAITVNDFLSLAMAYGYDDCFGQPLAS